MKHNLASCNVAFFKAPHSKSSLPYVVSRSRREHDTIMFPAQSLARRGLDVAHGFAGKPDDERPQISPLATMIFLLTCAFFFLVLAAISYTYGHLITTLAMVESPSSTAYVPIQTVAPADDAPPAYTEDGEDEVPKPVDHEDNLVRTQPITASLRGTILHLKARGGFWSRFRGLSVYFVWNFTRSLVVGILSAASKNPFVLILAAVVAEIALVRHGELLE